VTSYSTDLYLTASHRRIIWSTTSFHLRLRENDTPNSWASSPHTGAHNIPSLSQRGTTHPSHGHTQLMGFLTPHRGTQRSISVSERNNTPISWAHPTHGLPHRPTHSVYVLEDVSRSCNHQQFLSCMGLSNSSSTPSHSSHSLSLSLSLHITSIASSDVDWETCRVCRVYNCIQGCSSII
jgi:hypothetical protein